MGLPSDPHKIPVDAYRAFVVELSSRYHKKLDSFSIEEILMIASVHNDIRNKNRSKFESQVTTPFDSERNISAIICMHDDLAEFGLMTLLASYERLTTADPHQTRSPDRIKNPLRE